MMKRGAGEVERKSVKKSEEVNERGKRERKIKRKNNRNGWTRTDEKTRKAKKKAKKRSKNKLKRKAKKKAKKRQKNKLKRKGKKKNKKKNKDKLKRKLKKIRGRNPKNRRQKGRQTTTAACSNLTCLTALVSVLKFEKDTVRNFLAQEKRTNSKLTLMQNKQNRSDKYMGTAKFLEKRLGETSAHKSDGPLCKGSYNTSEGIKVKYIEFKSKSYFSEDNCSQAE